MPLSFLKSRPSIEWIVGGALVIFALWGFNQIVQKNARHTALVAARVANEKVEKARIVFDEKQWLLSLAGCDRGNKIRTAIKNNSQGTKDLALQLAASRRIAATLEVGGDHAALAQHDLKVANGYVKLANRQTWLPQVDCAAKWPDPHPQPKHQ